MKAKELQVLSEGELLDKLDEVKKELMKENAQISSGTTPKSPGQIKQLKKTIAKIHTILNIKNMEKKKVHQHG